jgi:3-hydroxybutyryl-CoA dehydrogenase
MKTAVIGAGIMGSGIAQLAAMHGHAVVLRDVDDDALARARRSIDRSLDKLVEKDRIGQDDAALARKGLQFTTDLPTAVRDAEVVIEAVPEVLDLKHAVFREIVGNAPNDALLGTNTSQLSITTIAAPLGAAAERLVGMHFFNPPVLMRLCELVRGLQTSDESLNRASDFAERIGKTVVVCRKDSPGFITSRAYAILRLECLRMLEEGIASAEDIDTAMRLGFNFPMGPLELGDFNGLDTYLHAIEALERVHGDRYRPTVQLRNMVAAGRLGRKTGHGFYRYDDNGQRTLDDRQAAG